MKRLQRLESAELIGVAAIHSGRLDVFHDFFRAFVRLPLVLLLALGILSFVMGTPFVFITGRADTFKGAKLHFLVSLCCGLMGKS